MKRICTFAGHGKIYYDEETKRHLEEKCIFLINNFGVNEFWVGNYGNFDKTAAAIVRKLNTEYENITLTLVLPYITNEIKEYKHQYYKNYDNILIADIPENTNKRFMISKCNRYMIDRADFLIAYVNSPCGGAAQTLKYALRKNTLNIFNLAE